METPVELDFQGVAAQPDLRGIIDRHIAQLEVRFGRVTSGRVVVKGPSGRHRSGGVYEINVRLALPEGREVNIARTPQADERNADLAFALNDAFKRAQRQLQGQVDRMMGNVKSQAPP